MKTVHPGVYITIFVVTRNYNTRIFNLKTFLAVGGGGWWWDCVRKCVVPYTGIFFYFPLVIITTVIENFIFLKIFIFLKKFYFLKFLILKVFSFFHEPFPFPAHERDVIFMIKK